MREAPSVGQYIKQYDKQSGKHCGNKYVATTIMFLVNANHMPLIIVGGYDEPSIFDPQESELSTVVPHIQNTTRAMTTDMDEPHYRSEGPGNRTISTMPPQTTVPQGGGPPSIRPEPQEEHAMEPEPKPLQ